MTDSLRASDAERREVGDLLSRHFSDGRLDQAELDERLGQAMGAKTRGDLARLLVDLPRFEEPPLPAPRPRRMPGRAAAIALALALLFGAMSLLAHVRTAQVVRVPGGPASAVPYPPFRHGAYLPIVRSGPPPPVSVSPNGP